MGLAESCPGRFKVSMIFAEIKERVNDWVRNSVKSSISKCLQKVSPDSFLRVGRVTFEKVREERGVMQGVLDQNSIAAALINRTRGAFGEKIGLMASMFGCWHKRLTRPISDKNSSYRACIDCGARKRFDTQDFRSLGPFYYPPIVASENI